MKSSAAPDPIGHSQLRAIQYQNVDGSYDLTFGGLFLLMALCFMTFALFPALNSDIALFVIVMAMVLGGFLSDRLSRRLKERVTFPRTGYLAYKQEPRPLKGAVRLALWIGVPVCIVIVWTLLFLYRAQHPALDNAGAWSLIPGFFGLMFCGLYAIIAWKMAWRRYYLISGVALLTGLGLLVSLTPSNPGLAILFGSLSLSLLVSGGLTLRAYLQRNPMPREGME
jgi:hypothetical protein